MDAKDAGRCSLWVVLAQLIYRGSIIRKKKMDMRRQSVIPVTDCEWREWDWYSRRGKSSWTSEKEGASLKI